MTQVQRVRTGLTKAQTRDTLGSLNVSMGLRAVYDQTTGASTLLFTAFALSLGVPGERMGVLASISTLACVLQVAGVMLTRHVSDKKGFVLTLSAVEPAIMVGAVLALPLLPQHMRFSALI